MLEQNKCGIYAIRVYAGTNNSTMTVLASQCKEMTLDEESGGVWYMMDKIKFVVPVMETMIYVYPAGVVQISFNE